MNACWLLGRGGQIFVSDQGVSDSNPEPDPATPLLVSPSRTLRKHFRVPGDLEGEESDVMRELFARYLPGSLEDYYCQFVIRGEPVEDKQDVLGLAVHRDYLELDAGFLTEERPVYILERLLAAHARPRVTLLSLPLPEGLYLGLLGKTLLWGRFLPDPDETVRDEALQSVRNQDSQPAVEKTLPEFPGVDSTSTRWAREFLELLPESPNPAWDLRRTHTAWDLSRWRRPAWGLLALLIVTLGTLWGVSLYEQAQYRDWVQDAFRDQFERAPRYPVEELRSALNRARQRAAAAREKTIYQYPRLVALDGALKSARLRVLRIELNREGASMVLLTPTLEIAEEYLDRLRARPPVKSARIQSSRSRTRGSYRFQVTLQLGWESS